MMAPFMKLARSEATKTATVATSSGVQIRPSGMPSVSRATPLASPLAVLPYGACPAPE
jgi:hypothetical protein